MLRKLLIQHALIALGLVLVGVALKSLLMVFLVGCAAMLAWHIAQLYRLDQWLHNAAAGEPEIIDSAWRGIYSKIDITKRRDKKRKRKLKRIFKRYRAGIAALPDAVLVVDESDHLKWCNQTAMALLSIDPARDFGLPIGSLIRSPAFVEFLQGPDPRGVDIAAPSDDDIKLRVRLATFDRNERLLLISDVSATQRAERIRRDFIANASHELRTPLTVVIGYLEALLDDPSIDQDRLRVPLEFMHEQADRMQRMIEDLLLLSRLESETAADLMPVNVPALVERLANDARGLSGQDQHVISVECDAHLWLTGNEAELYSALSNLVFNAIRHTPEGSTIELEWRVSPSGEPEFAVTDDGPGIASRHLSRLTERFYRVGKDRQRSIDKASTGTGLGLAIVKHVIQRHDGRLEIDSQLDEGSSFTCRFHRDRRSTGVHSQFASESGASDQTTHDASMS